MPHPAGLPVSPSPSILWVELTSKCPVDCVFCSRQTRRGAGAHLPFPVYSALLDDLVAPRKFVLNYSGESTVYPDLIPAIQRARAAGAWVELVSALVTAPESLLVQLSRSGLNRLTVSVHATDPEIFQQIYRYSSFRELKSRLERFVELCRAVPQPAGVDLAFVAMDRNLAQLQPVAALASELAIRDITVFPIIRRDEIPARFDEELDASRTLRPEFGARVRSAVRNVEETHPDIRITVCNAGLTGDRGELGTVPVPWPWELPEGALIHSCEQNPWETTHILSNGDVVPCEVLDKTPLGNLHRQSMREIWHGEAYQRMRERYRCGEIPECRSCAWKKAYRPGPTASEILATRGAHPQLAYGWHEPRTEDHIWSSRQAAAILAPAPGSRTLHVAGALPPGLPDQPNHLSVSVNGVEVGRLENPWEEVMPFGLDFPVDAGQTGVWTLEFRTAHVYRPSERGTGSDQRDLGFALGMAVSKPQKDPERAASRSGEVLRLRRFIATIDRFGARLPTAVRRDVMDGNADWRPGLSILIPEYDNRDELAACLAGAAQAAKQWAEPLETIVMVNGSPASDYIDLRRKHPAARWSMHRRPLGFSGAIAAGLRLVRHDWVYLLNNDVVLEPRALSALAPARAADVFSVASQIVLKDATCFRDETNWTTLLVESGLATIHDWLPKTDDVVPTFYAGGGASLFRTRLLRRWLDTDAYNPFYWEDVEWGWRARKSGYQSVFCPESIARHTRRATIGKHYSPQQVSELTRRNALLFQLRNFTTAGSLEAALEEIASGSDLVAEALLSWRARARIARGRWWNHGAPISDEAVFAAWDQATENWSCGQERLDLGA